MENLCFFPAQLKPSDETLKQGRNRDRGVISDSPFQEENMEEAIECILELIERMKKFKNKNWKNILRLKQKIILK